jgi:hypothetical protein
MRNDNMVLHFFSVDERKDVTIDLLLLKDHAKLARILTVYMHYSYVYWK